MLRFILQIKEVTVMVEVTTVLALSIQLHECRDVTKYFY